MNSYTQAPEPLVEPVLRKSLTKGTSHSIPGYNLKETEDIMNSIGLKLESEIGKLDPIGFIGESSIGLYFDNRTRRFHLEGNWVGSLRFQENRSPSSNEYDIPFNVLVKSYGLTISEMRELFDSYPQKNEDKSVWSPWDNIQFDKNYNQLTKFLSSQVQQCYQEFQEEYNAYT